MKISTFPGEPVVINVAKVNKTLDCCHYTSVVGPTPPPPPPPTCVLLEKGKVDIINKTGSEIGKQAAARSGGLFAAEDWQCSV